MMLSKVIEMAKNLEKIGNEVLGNKYEVSNFVDLVDDCDGKYTWVYESNATPKLISFREDLATTNEGFSEEIKDKYLVILSEGEDDLVALCSGSANWIYDDKYDSIELEDAMIPWEYLAEKVQEEIEENLRVRLQQTETHIVSKINRLNDQLALLDDMELYVQSL